jgi:hypothetical protein
MNHASRKALLVGARQRARQEQSPVGTKTAPTLPGWRLVCGLLLSAVAFFLCGFAFLREASCFKTGA